MYFGSINTAGWCVCVSSRCIFLGRVCIPRTCIPQMECTLGLYILRVHICAEGICILSSYISQGSAAYIMGSNVCAWLLFFPFCVEFAILGSSLFWVTAVDYAVASSCISRYIIRGVKKKEMMT